MSDILKTAQGWVKSLSAKLPNVASSKAPMRVIFGVLFVFVLLVFLFVAGWLQDWAVNGKADLKVMISFIQSFSNQSMILFITFLAKGFIDADHDGTPDVFENETGKEEKKNV